MSNEKQHGMRLAILVVGPPSSGNRWVASIIAACGVYGHPSSDQPLLGDLALWANSHDKIVVVVHGNIDPWIRELRRLGYEVRAVVIVRDPHCTTISQRLQGHENFHMVGQGELPDALRDLHFRDVPWEIWPYEALISRYSARQAMCSRMGLELPQDVEARDGNERYYAHPEVWRVGLVP